MSNAITGEFYPPQLPGDDQESSLRNHNFYERNSYADYELQTLSQHITRTRGPARPLIASRRAVPRDRYNMAHYYGIPGLAPPKRITTNYFVLPVTVLVMITVLTVLLLTGRRNISLTEATMAAAFTPPVITVDRPPPDFDEDSLPLGGLPPGDDYTEVGAASWHIVPPPHLDMLAGIGIGHIFTYTVEIENGITTPVIRSDERAFGIFVDSVLKSEHSWIHEEKSFRRIGRQGKPDFRISLTTPTTTRKFCGYSIKVESSCYLSSKVPGKSRVYLNLARWIRGAKAYRGDYINYRIYQINHEIGHAIGYAKHKPCEKDNALAPVMMQQTFGIANDDIYTLDPSGVVSPDGKVCKPNPWPYPPQ